MTDLKYLVDEICAGVEVYYTGKQGGQYLKTAFILCDDYTELASKLFLLKGNPAWVDSVPIGRAGRTRFKNYADIQNDVKSVFRANRAADLPTVERLLGQMLTRRYRRNDFFHSTKLLDLNVTARNCTEAFCDLMEYGELLFGADWQNAVAVARNLETLCVLLRLELKSYSDPSVSDKVNEILRDWPTNISKLRKTGAHVSEHPADFHLRLCVTYGGKQLRDKLRPLL